jgi:hypothetical protein
MPRCGSHYPLGIPCALPCGLPFSRVYLFATWRPKARTVAGREANRRGPAVFSTSSLSFISTTAPSSSSSSHSSSFAHSAPRLCATAALRPSSLVQASAPGELTPCFRRTSLCGNLQQHLHRARCIRTSSHAPPPRRRRWSLATADPLRRRQNSSSATAPLKVGSNLTLLAVRLLFRSWVCGVLISSFSLVFFLLVDLHAGFKSGIPVFSPTLAMSDEESSSASSSSLSV